MTKARKGGGGDSSSGESRFARVMAERGRPFRVVPMPGLDCEKVALWCPTEGEESEANIAARKWLTEEHKLDALQLSLSVESELFQREYELELLAMVLRDPDDPEMAYVDDADALRDGLEKPQREQLMEMMQSFRRERFLLDLPNDPDKVVELLRGLKEVSSVRASLMSCDVDTLLTIIDCLMDRTSGTPTRPPSSAT